MPAMIELPVVEIVERYLAGESTIALALVYGVNHKTIGRRLKVAGVRLPHSTPFGNTYARGWHKRGGSLYDGGRGYLTTRDRENKECAIHRGCWEARYGAIPEAHIVHHKNGERLDNAIGNLACMTQGEHATLHHAERCA